MFAKILYEIIIFRRGYSMRVPHTFSIIFGLIVIFAVLTWVLPAGQFDTVYDENVGRELVVPGSYHVVESNPQGFMSVFTAFARGIIDSAEIIAFVLIVGGAYGVILKTGAIDSGLRQTIRRLGKNDKFVIPILMILFSIGGTTTGMSEETLPFFLMMIPLMIALRYDAIVGVSVIFVGAAAGVLGSTVNPFATGIASAIAEVDLADGLSHRVVIYLLVTTVSILYVMRYAAKVKADPSKSIIADSLEEHREHFLNHDAGVEGSDGGAGVGNGMGNANSGEFLASHKVILLMFAGMILFMIYSIIYLGWWMQEITMLFLVVAMLSGFISRMKDEVFWNAFISGAQDLLSAALVIGLARGIVLIAQDGVIMDTILSGTSEFLSGLSTYMFIVLNQMIQIGIAFLVPSTSGHAALTMTIMAPLADLFEVPRSLIVTVYQSASGAVNLITPTSGVLIAALAMARVSWVKWVKFIFPLVVINTVISLGVVLVVL